MEGVKIHEYYHNINGSQVTGQSPFEIWLNEAVTVHTQRRREADLFGADSMRLKVLLEFGSRIGPHVSRTHNILSFDDPTRDPAGRQGVVGLWGGSWGEGGVRVGRTGE